MNKKNTKYWIMGAVAVIILIGLTFPFLLAKSRLNAEIAKLRKEGIPVTPREFADKYYKPVPKTDNGADTFDEAYGLYADVDEKGFKKLIVVGVANSPQYDQKIEPQLLTAAQEFINDNKDLLAKMSELRKYDCVRFDLDWDNVYDIRFPRLGKFRNTARIYYVKTELLINQNNPQEAGKLLKEIFHINRLMGQNPFMIGQLVFYACDAISTAMLERCMNTLSFSPEQLKEFGKICAEHEKYVIQRWPYMWKVELTLSLNSISLKELENLWFSPYESYPYIKKIPKKYRSAFYYYSGSYINDVVSLSKSSRAMMDMPLDVYSIRKTEIDKIKTDSDISANAYMILEASTNVYPKTLEAIARLRCAATACAVERFHLKYKKLPEQLEQLVPEFLPKVPIDPFDGKPLRYFRGNFDMRYDEPMTPGGKEEKGKPKEETESIFGIIYKTVTLKKSGFYVYSIGRDLSDDSSLPLWERRINKDILFIVIDKK